MLHGVVRDSVELRIGVGARRVEVQWRRAAVREVHPGDARAAAAPRERVQPEVTLQVQQVEAGDVREQPELHVVQWGRAGEEPVHVVVGVLPVAGGALVPERAVGLEILIVHGPDRSHRPAQSPNGLSTISTVVTKTSTATIPLEAAIRPRSASSFPLISGSCEASGTGSLGPGSGGGSSPSTGSTCTDAGALSSLAALLSDGASTPRMRS